MRVGIVFASAIVQILRSGFMRRQLFQPFLVVFQQSRFVVVDKNRSRNVHRIYQHQTLLDLTLVQAIFHLLGDVDECPSARRFKPQVFAIALHSCHHNRNAPVDLLHEVNIAIIGAGNLGAYLGAHLANAGHQVFLCARNGPQSSMPADVVLLTVKAYDTASALTWLHDLCSQGQPVAVIQNGVNQAARVAPFNGISVISYVYVEAGRAYPPPGAELLVPVGESSERFAELFASTEIQVRIEPAFHTASWRKMLHNCVSNPLTTLAGRGLKILAESSYRDWAERILAEALPIAQAEGAELTEVDAENILATLASYPPGTRTSMLQDFERGKRLEIDVLNGTLVELGRQHGLSTNLNEELVRLISERAAQMPVPAIHKGRCVPAISG